MMSPGDKSGMTMALYSHRRHRECESQSDVAYVAQSLRRLRFHAIDSVIAPIVAYGSHPASRLIPIDRQVILRVG